MNAAQQFRAITSTTHLAANLRQASARAALFTGAAGFADFALRIGSTAILARMLVPAQFGLVMMVTAIVAVAEQFRDLGLSTATVQRETVTHEEISNLFWINLAVSAALGLALCAVSPAIAHYYREPELVAITCALSVGMVFGGAMVQHQALLTRQLKLGHTAAVRLLTSVFSTALAIALAAENFGEWALVWREVARAALLAFGMWWCLPWIPGLPSRRGNVRPFLDFGANLTFANILSALASNADRFLLGRLWGAGPVALYRQAYQLVCSPTDQLLSPLYQVTQPALSMLQNDPVRYERYFARILTLVCLITMPVSLFIAVYSDNVTALLLGEKWLAAAPILCVLSFSMFIKQAVSSTAFILLTRGKSAMYLGISALQNAVFTVAACIGVQWGTIGIAVAELATTYLMIAPRLYYTLRNSPVSSATWLRCLVRPIIASVAMGFVLLVLRSLSFGGLAPNSILLGSVAGLVSFMSTWLLMPGGWAEMGRVWLDVRTAFQRKMRPSAPAHAIAITN